MEELLSGEDPYDRAPGVVDDVETMGLLMYSSFNGFTDGSMRALWRTYVRPNAKGNGVAPLCCGNYRRKNGHTDGGTNGQLGSTDRL